MDHHHTKKLRVDYTLSLCVIYCLNELGIHIFFSLLHYELLVLASLPLYFTGPMFDLLITWLITSEKTSPTAIAPEIIDAFAASERATL
jgi:hypothetical protein